MDIRPFVRYAAHHVWLDTYWLNRSIWDHEFIFIEQGSLRFVIENTEYIAKENDLVILPPRVLHYIGWNGENCSQPHVHFDFVELPNSKEIAVSKICEDLMTKYEKSLFRENFYDKNGIEIPYILHLKDPMSIKNLLFKIIEEYEHQRPFRETLLKGLMTEFITLVFRENEAVKVIDDTSRQLNEIITYMNENVDKNLSLLDFAEKFKISQWVLNQIFNKHYDCSPMKYYNKVKLLRAIDLLKYSFYSINDIGEKMGFNDPQTFSRWFKNLDGNYPSFYRKNQ